MKPLILKGKPALSGFRAASLIENIQKTSPSLGAERINTSSVYFVETDSRLSEEILDKTYSLLGTGESFNDSGTGFFVIPRKGTISPWSSKATDIFHNCGLTEIRRVEHGIYYELFRSDNTSLSLDDVRSVLHFLHDRMTDGIYTDVSDIFQHMEPSPCVEVDILNGGEDALQKANINMGLALSAEEIHYLCESFKAANRNPTDVELVMFGQVNSEHCRHKIFNADWIIDGSKKDISLFGMIKNTYNLHPAGTLVAYKDNSSVIEGFDDKWFEVSRDGEPVYKYNPAQVDIIMKVETHNHPTGICPYPGAATGVGGEIRDEAATGTGSKTKAGLCAFMVSNLRVPDFIMPWEKEYAEFPVRMATPLEIMIEGPIGGARFGNEFGRPQLVGLFKTFEERYNGKYRGYHKPIMVAGGMGNIKRVNVEKKPITKDAHIIQIGGPALRIGLGGGTASSMALGSNVADLDYNSVQRDNAEMQRRCQEVIDACTAMDDKNPILSIHDLGAGGLSNGCPELVSEIGARFELRKINNEDKSMSPMEIWCCEAQERYVFAVASESLDMVLALCERERCPVAVIGQATGDKHLSLHDEHFNNTPIDLDLQVLFGKPPKMLRDVKHLKETHIPVNLKEAALREAVERVLRFPAVSNKTFLITIADRSITGMVARDQMVGPYQTPISDLAVTATSYNSVTGEAMAMGERTSTAVLSAPASGRMAIGEAITNIAAANIGSISNIKLSANWMCPCGEEGEDANLYNTAQAVGMELCPALGICIPVGKDSLSMRTIWETSDGKKEKMTAPMSLVISSFASVKDVRKTVTSDFKRVDNSQLILIDLGRKKNRLGASALARVYNQIGDQCADVDSPQDLLNFFNAVQEMIDHKLLLAYHDRSDGGLFVTLSEMAFGGRTNVKACIDGLGNDPFSILFSEEMGAVIQIAQDNLKQVRQILNKHNISDISHDIGAVTTADSGADRNIEIIFENKNVFTEKISILNRIWSELTYRMQALRDNPECAKQEFDNLLDENDPGMTFKVMPNAINHQPSTINHSPKMAILREQGINGQVEMAAAFDRAGFESIDVHMTDLQRGLASLDDFSGLVACGGFSYGDVLGAGSGWAKSILFNQELKEMFARFFERPDTFTLGVCNGCQMISQLKDIIPGAEDWPDFTRNRSEQFEARYVTVEILPSQSIFFKGMTGSRLGIPVAHGEGLANFAETGSIDNIRSKNLLSVRYVDNYGKPSERYPFNPNGSPEGITGVTTTDGRVTIMMPHPERVFRSLQMSYRPVGMFDNEEGPWLEMFRNARKFVE
ncbi:phosphoribosylformylglycinamidine synthase [Verrucomicrobiota bacterium]